MSDKDKTRQEPDDRLDWILRNVQEPTEQLRKLQTDMEAFLWSALAALEDFRNSAEVKGGKAPLQRLEALLTRAQDAAAEALTLSGKLATVVDQEVLESVQGVD